MAELAYRSTVLYSDSAEEESAETTLYDLISAMSDDVESDGEGLVVAAVLDLVESGKIKWSRRHKGRDLLI